LISVFQNTKRAEKVPKPDLGVVILRWRVGVRVFIARCFNETRAEKTKKCFERTNITTLNSTLAPLWVQGEEVLCCIATALRGLGHQRRRKVVRSDKFVEPFDNVMKSWVTWVLRSIRHVGPL
jgi:hypothetical protein